MIPKFKINEVVWAKLSNKPWWPGIVIAHQLEEKEYSVLFIGDSSQ